MHLLDSGAISYEKFEDKRNVIDLECDNFGKKLFSMYSEDEIDGIISKLNDVYTSRDSIYLSYLEHWAEEAIKNSAIKTNV